MGATEDQIAFWNGAAGQRWVTEQRDRDAMLASYGDAAIAATRVTEGEAVLDVGCGCGTTTVAFADRVGARGRVLGVDLSVPMIERARALAGERANVAFESGDAATMPLPAEGFDVLYSRFGVMFFPDPVTAFAHLGGALKRGGRFAFVCWRGVADNPWAKLPYDAAVAELGAPPQAGDPSAPGPFAFADAGRVCGMLEQAGFRSAEAAPFDSRVVYGKTPEDAAKRVVTMGPAMRVLEGRDDATVARVVARTAKAIARYAGDEGVAIPGGAWVVTARRG